MEVTERNKGKAKELPKPNNIVTVPYNTEDLSFYKWWCIFLRPFVNLTNKEVDVIAAFLKQRRELSKSILDPALLDRLVMSEEVKKRIVKECNITLPHFYVIMNNLRKHGVIQGNVINPRLIPNQRDFDEGYFQLLILFKGQKSSDKV